MAGRAAAPPPVKSPHLDLEVGRKNSVNVVEVIVSGLPGAPSLSQVSAERLTRNGIRCGSSIYRDKKGADVRIRHCLRPLAPEPGGSVTWRTVAQQTLEIKATIRDDYVGLLKLKRCTTAGFEVSHGDVWFADNVNVTEPYRRRRIAGAMYRHAQEQGYLIGPSYGVLPAGRSLWASLDPSVVFPGGNGSATQSPRVAVPPDPRDEAALARIADRYRRDPTLEDALRADPKRLLEDGVARELFGQLAARAVGVIIDTRNLLLNVVLLNLRLPSISLTKAIRRWSFGRPVREQESWWRRQLPGPRRRSAAFEAAATLLARRIDELCAEDSRRFSGCQCCSDRFIGGLPDMGDRSLPA
jgi:hypothetical protein